ncbi:protein EE15 [Proboscivirus elephantidbeta5]|uniref:Protein EE15 n=1 Tax=Elephant endotheliotropic herpesvirus 5 TaxID=768738 RepID=A0A075CZR2_9BETA|nr:protein EE15 [Elephant endotheliotropic herpesvirus 5]AHC02789.1 protein EE15 [Elephant endotheliotropic herpesvirus 5]
MNPVDSNDHLDSMEKTNTDPKDVCLEMGLGDGDSLAASLLNLAASMQNVSNDPDRNPSPPPPYTTLLQTPDLNFDPSNSNVYERLQQWWTSVTETNGIPGTNAPQTLLLLLLLLFTLSHRFEDNRHTLHKKTRRIMFFVTTLAIVFMIYGISSIVYLSILR